MKNKSDVILKIEEQSVVEEVAEVFKALNRAEQKEMMAVIRGLKIGIALRENDEKSRGTGQAS